MREDVKEFADAMERGWKLCPKMTSYAFFNGDPEKPSACCANGHAALGMFGDASRETDLKFAWTQQVQREGDPNPENTRALTYVIDELVGCRDWTTPQVIAWLRSHQND